MSIYWVRGDDARINASYLQTASVDGTVSNGSVVTFSGGVFTAAKADTQAHAQAIGIAANVSGGTADIIVRNGQFAGYVGLTPGSIYYLSQSTAGAITATKPSSGIVVQIGIALSSTQLLAFVSSGVTSVGKGGEGLPQYGDLTLTQGTGIKITRTNTDFAIAEDFKEYDGGTVSGAFNVDWNNGFAQKVTLSANGTITLLNPSVAVGYVLRVVQSGAAGFTITWPANVKWPNNVTPVMSTTPGNSDFFAFYYNGTNYLGSATNNYSSS